MRCASARPGRRTSRAAFFEDAIDPEDPLLGFAAYVHKAPRANSITPERQRAFIAALAASGIVTQAARAIGASMEALYKLRALPGAEGFARAWNLAVDRGMMRLEDCALERAIRGEERPVVSGGEVVATWTRHDTQLMLFLLRQRLPERYGDPHRDSRRDPRPGDPLYERIRAEIEASYPSLEDVRASIQDRIAGLRAQVEARKAAEAAQVAAGE
ncbi:MAG: hypothetical protein K0R64_172 [Novosphingobium lindaniclasticum]|uniref:hypothetical protein n=1 Tax=Novosphingobium lindaniclasticum TaxID=1329895 RepID=UPI0024092894|nr:hypothetical protein [Novosphingobium lindaniclasticum]MDF2637188.1 hypothetical protein [Novosphingobium lindaniclasticum]